MMKRLAMVLLVQIVALALFGSGAFALGPLSGPSASEIDGKVTASLNQLYSQNDAARALGAKAKAILVFPDIRKGAFIVGAQYGYGALRKGSQTAAYYRTSAASYGFQGGVKKFAYALFFMTDSAVDYLDKSGGWAIGTGPSLVVVDEGMARFAHYHEHAVGRLCFRLRPVGPDGWNWHRGLKDHEVHAISLSRSGCRASPQHL